MIASIILILVFYAKFIDIIFCNYCCGYHFVFLFEEQVGNESSGKQKVVGESSVKINCSDGDGLTELEKMLKQKTFTRYFSMTCMTVCYH